MNNNSDEMMIEYIKTMSKNGLLDTDLVEAVRCENCKYFITNYAVPHCGRTLIGMKKSDYCSYGERKEE